MKLQEALDEEAILEEQMLALMHRFADRFMDRRVEINNLIVLHDHPLIDYGKYALGCMTGADMKGKTNVNATSKGVSAVITLELVSTVEPTMFNDEDVTMKMARTLIKLKAEKARIHDEKIAQKLHDEEVQKAAAKDKQERADMEKSLELQKQLDVREDDIDWSVVAKQVKERQSD
nr:hypothetical protein [Tanacetum cinerariifolium]